jgi:hypothetical protein
MGVRRCGCVLAAVPDVPDPGRAFLLLIARQAPQLFIPPTDTMSSKPSNGLSMTYATSAPATSGGQPGSPVRFSCVCVALQVAERRSPARLLLLLSNR